MPFRYYSPGITLFSLVVAGLLRLFGKSSKKRKYASASTPVTPQKTEEEKNISAMQKIVSEYEGYTAEVVDISVFGRRRVETFRLLSPGRKVELRYIRGDIKVFAYGEYMAELITSKDSNLPRLFEEHVPFDAFLGGRDLGFMYNNQFDFCSIIVFYKLDGVPPTKVNLR